MGHRSIATTQGYYSVTATRMRRAVDSLAGMQFNGRGEHVWSQARVLLESEHQRLAVGQVAVPFGICTEPSNVQAGLIALADTGSGCNRELRVGWLADVEAPLG